MTLYTQEELDVTPADHDMHLLRQYAYEGSEWAFSEIVERHGKWIYGICRRALHDRELAEDATQAVFLTLSRKAAGMPDQTRLSGWLYRATCFAVADARKRERRYRRREEVARRLAAERLEPSAMPQAAEPEVPLDQALAALNERDRNVILMHFYEGLTVRQMGEVLSLSREGAKKRVSRALARLRAKMGAKAPAAASVASGLATALQVSSLEAMPTGLAQSIVSAATGVAASTTLRGAGIAGAVLRAMTSGVSSSLLRSTAAAKLAGATAVVAACVIYQAPLGRVTHRAAPAVQLSTTPVSSLNNSIGAASVRVQNLAGGSALALGSNFGATSLRQNNAPTVQTINQGNVVMLGGATHDLRPAVTEVARHDERPALPDPVVRGDNLRAGTAAIDLAMVAARGSGSGGDDSAPAAAAAPATAEPAVTRAAAKPVDNSAAGNTAAPAAQPAADNSTHAAAPAPVASAAPTPVACGLAPVPATPALALSIITAASAPTASMSSTPTGDSDPCQSTAAGQMNSSAQASAEASTTTQSTSTCQSGAPVQGGNTGQGMQQPGNNNWSASSVAAGSWGGGATRGHVVAVVGGAGMQGLTPGAYQPITLVQVPSGAGFGGMHTPGGMASIPTSYELAAVPSLPIGPFFVAGQHGSLFGWSGQAAVMSDVSMTDVPDLERIDPNDLTDPDDNDSGTSTYAAVPVSPATLIAIASAADSAGASTTTAAAATNSDSSDDAGAAASDSGYTAAPPQGFAYHGHSGDGFLGHNHGAWGGGSQVLAFDGDPGSELHPLDLAPEPSSLAIVAGVAGLLCGRRRRPL